MDQEIPNEHQSSPAQIVALVTENAQYLQREPGFTEGTAGGALEDAQDMRATDADRYGNFEQPAEETQEAQCLREAETSRSNPEPESPFPEGVELPPPAVEIPRLVPRQSTFVPAPYTWWIFVDRDPGFALRVNYQENDQLVNTTQMTFTEAGVATAVEVTSEPLNEFRAGFYIEADLNDACRFDLILKSGISKKRVKSSDSERPSTDAPASISALFSSIGTELGVDQTHVQRLTESALEGLRTFVALKSFVDSSPVVSALFELMKLPVVDEIAKTLLAKPVQYLAEDAFHLLLNDSLVPVAESLQKMVDEKVDLLRSELVVRRKWEDGFEEITRNAMARIEQLEGQFRGIVEFVEKVPSSALAGAMASVTTSADAIDSRINPQLNELREQIANLFERCDNIERNRLKDQQARSRAEKARKQASAAKAPERKEAVNAASRTLQERKRREKKENEALARAADRRVGPRKELPKRGRGRPPTRKAVAVVNLFDGAPVKRGRGRPRKNP